MSGGKVSPQEATVNCDGALQSIDKCFDVFASLKTLGNIGVLGLAWLLHYYIILTSFE